ncbi:MAG: hypothetical protein KF789_00190 [Bdellovibrionaceae bacterium]|nr:hypothetical protein [Pseudobdellovibrionaceae bacterium]
MKTLSLTLLLLMGMAASGCASREKYPLQKADSSEVEPGPYGNPVITSGNPSIDAAIALPFAVVAAVQESKAFPDNTIGGSCHNEDAGPASSPDCSGLFVQIKEGTRSIKTLPITRGLFSASDLRRGSYRVILFQQPTQPLAEKTVSTGQSIDFTLRKNLQK